MSSQNVIYPPLLLAGASGNVGQAILNQLQPAQTLIRTLSRRPEQQAKLQSLATEVVLADALVSASLKGICEGIDVVISCLGASVSMQSSDKRPFSQVDYVANCNLLEVARQSGVRKFIYVAVWAQAGYEHTKYVQGHEYFVQKLSRSGLDYAVIRPPGIFCTMLEFLDMARRGTAPLLGDGSARTNPVHEIDVATACLAAIFSSATEIGVGGPEILTRKQIYELAFAALGKPPKFLSVPAALMRWGGKLAQWWNPRMAELLEFAACVSTHDGIAPTVGTHTLADYFAEAAKH